MNFSTQAKLERAIRHRNEETIREIMEGLPRRDRDYEDIEKVFASVKPYTIQATRIRLGDITIRNRLGTAELEDA